MRKFFLMVMTVGAMAPAGASAQKVYKSGSQVILDLTEAAGMPAGAITDTAKYVGFTPTETELGTANTPNGSINARVFQKLEVAKYDLSGDGTTGSSGGRFPWVNAFNYCRNIGTGWRLPTQRELMLMFIFKNALNDIITEISGKIIPADNYWSSMEYSSTESWIVSLKDGGAVDESKTIGYPVRCVREVSN